MKPSIAAVALLSLAVSAGAASAQSNRSREVAIGGVDFNDRAQVERLHLRLQRAALRICTDPGRVPVNRRAEQGACAAAALDRAVATIDRPQLTLAHSGAATPIQVARR